MKIGFNKPYPAGKEMEYIADAVRREHISGNGFYTKSCQHFFERRYNFRKTLLTSSCTDALEMCAILLDIQSGDEVIMPSYTFSSSANAFILRGAKIVFADSCPQHPNLDTSLVRDLITPRTRAIVAVHYGGIACDMEALMALAEEYNLFIIEDAAQAIDAYYKDRPLGGIGHLGCFSFHESKNITCGEGGLLIINDERFIQRAEVIWEKGTNRAAFFRGEIDKYSWIDVGSSFLLSELNAAFLLAQLERLDDLQDRRKHAWGYYYKGLSGIPELQLPYTPSYSTNNAHNFYITCKTPAEKVSLESWLKLHDIQGVGHYLPLHSSTYYLDKHDGRNLVNATRFSQCLLRLPLYYELTPIEQQVVIRYITEFLETRSKQDGNDELAEFRNGRVIPISLVKNG